MRGADGVCDDASVRSHAEIFERAAELDADDPLAPWRSEFVVPDPDLVYLDGNSLGRTPRRAITALADVVERQWAGDLITSWWEHGWLDLPLTVGDELAPLLGARAGEVVVHESTTICLFQLINVALDLRADPGRPATIAIADDEFPTDRYVTDGIARLRSVGAGPGVTIRRGLDDLGGVDVVVRSLVDYRTAVLADLRAETDRARAAGARVVWDLSHAAGVVEVDLAGSGAELAAGCTYKFLNGGPGSPAFAYVRRDLHERLVQPINGWFGQRDQFRMDAPWTPRTGIARLLNGTPSVIALTGARAGVSVTAEAGIRAIAASARSLATFAIDVAEDLDLTCPTPKPPASSGGHVIVRHPDAKRLQAALQRRGVLIDEREPDVLRFGLSPLTTTHADIARALTTLAELLAPTGGRLSST